MYDSNIWSSLNSIKVMFAKIVKIFLLSLGLLYRSCSKMFLNFIELGILHHEFFKVKSCFGVVYAFFCEILGIKVNIVFCNTLHI
jgi:hypothetical protein